MNRARREKRKAMRAAVVCDGSCDASDFGCGAMVGAVLVGILWLGCDSIVAAMAGVL
jgi:hypothetical protein